MYKSALILALAGSVAACATTQAQTAQSRDCVEKSERMTGTRVQTATTCAPAAPAGN